VWSVGCRSVLCEVWDVAQFCVKCRMSLSSVWSVGCRSILLEISNWEFPIVQLIYKTVEDFHICSCDGCIEEDGTNNAPPGRPTPNTSLLWMRGFFMYPCIALGFSLAQIREVWELTYLDRWNHRRNSGRDTGRTGKDFPKYGAPGSILSGRKWWPLPAHVMMSSHFLHNEASLLQISFQYPL
jgi:hypothetical protein